MFYFFNVIIMVVMKYGNTWVSQLKQKIPGKKPRNEKFRKKHLKKLGIKKKITSKVKKIR